MIEGAIISIKWLLDIISDVLEMGFDRLSPRHHLLEVVGFRWRSTQPTESLFQLGFDRLSPRHHLLVVVGFR
jgi:hypothetical protein